MEEDYMGKTQDEDRNDPQNCSCDSDCCQPKKSNIFTKLIFAVILLAAIGIIAVKLFYHPAPAANQQLFKDPNAKAWCDTTANRTCDTTKGSSCCPKSK